MFEFVGVIHNLPGRSGEMAGVTGTDPMFCRDENFGSDAFAEGGFVFGNLKLYSFAGEGAPDEGFFARRQCTNALSARD